MIKNFLLDLLFPIYCFSCQKEGSYLCGDCLAKVETLNSFSCFKCGKRLPDVFQCQTCVSKTIIKGLFSPCLYNDSLISDLIKTFKYRFIPDLAKPLSELIIKSLPAQIFAKQKFAAGKQNFSGQAVFVPVPLHKKRLRWRGFNQAELLTKELASHFHIPMESNIIKRIKATKPQSELSGEKRIKNVIGAFVVNETEKYKIKEKTIILVDDIKTTGATLEECAKILKENGAKKILAITIAR